MDTAFFLVSKLVSLGLRAETWLLVLLVIGLWRRWALFGALALVLAVGLVPLGLPLMRWLESQHVAAPPLPERIDGILVLGGGEDTGAFRRHGLPGANAAGERLTAGAALALAYPEARLVFTGGTSAILSNEGHAGPSQMAQALWQSLGVPAGQIVVEDRSRTTAENARLSYALLAPQPGQTWVLVTSAWHMPRSMATFESAGWTGLVAWPVDYRGYPARLVEWDLGEHLRDLNAAIKEVVGRLGYRLAGR